MIDLFDKELSQFLRLCEQNNVRMLMVGGGAVNLHGYQRHSADVDFWIEPIAQNLNRLILVMHELGYQVHKFPESVIKGQQNISFKFSPDSFKVELITHYSSTLAFEDAWKRSEVHKIGTSTIHRFRVIGLNDLIETKLKSGRSKDLIDVQELRKIQEENNN